MTTEQLEGRELDAAVARAMGDDVRFVGGVPFKRAKPEEIRTIDDALGYTVPLYHRDANAALTVRDWLMDNTNVVCDIETNAHGTFTVTMWWKYGEPIEATADTLPLAICRAFVAWAQAADNG